MSRCAHRRAHSRSQWIVVDFYSIRSGKYIFPKYFLAQTLIFFFFIIRLVPLLSRSNYLFVILKSCSFCLSNTKMHCTQTRPISAYTNIRKCNTKIKKTIPPWRITCLIISFNILRYSGMSKKKIKNHLYHCNNITNKIFLLNDTS